MALPSSGQISLSQVNTELGNTATAEIGMNSTALRTLFGIASGEIEMADGYGKSNAFSFTISSNTQEANLSTLATAAGWNGSSAIGVTISSGVYLWSDNVANPGLLVNVANATITNNGYIMGKGGIGGENAVGEDGGDAIEVTQTGCSITNASGAYIAGGGGGGGGQWNSTALQGGAGGGGAGGGDGADGKFNSGFTNIPGGAGGSIGNAGADGDSLGTTWNGKGGGSGGGGASVVGGGGGGRILPGTGGAGGSFYGVAAAGGDAGNAGASTPSQSHGGGGGGWGAAGGNSGTTAANPKAGGSGGAAINGTATLTNSGTVYGST